MLLGNRETELDSLLHALSPRVFETSGAVMVVSRESGPIRSPGLIEAVPVHETPTTLLPLVPLADGPLGDIFAIDVSALQQGMQNVLDNMARPIVQRWEIASLFTPPLGWWLVVNVVASAVTAEAFRRGAFRGLGIDLLFGA